jgi:ABC-type lipoprotein release transport system permease subunit
VPVGILGAGLLHTRHAVLVVLLVAVLAGATLAHLLLLSTRRSRHDFAVLKAVGFRRRELAATTRWQACTRVVGGLLVGVPLGIAVGRWTWNLTAHGIGAVAATRLPVATIAALVPLMFAFALVLAWLPGRLAARVDPAAALRSE